MISYIVLLLALLPHYAFTQLAVTLKPLNRCLGNCAICEINSLDTCSGTQMIQCIKGYNGDSCKLSPTMAVEVILNSGSDNPLIIEPWNQNKTEICSYTHKNGSIAQHTVLGMFQGGLEAKTVIEMDENYQNFIFSFNLVRSTWTPFSDLLVITLSDQTGKELKQGFIQYIRREDIDTNVNLLQCSGKPVITEKFQIDYVQGIQKIKQLHIKLQSMVYSGKWGITNAKLAFGCNNFLVYSQNSCSTCLRGYFKKMSEGKIIGCSVCPTSCQSCSSQLVCSACIEGFTLKDNTCVAAEHLLAIVRPVPSTFFQCNGVSLRMSSFQSSSSTYSVIGPIEFELPPHQEIRIIMKIAHTIPKEDRQSHSEEFFLQLDNQVVLDMKVMESFQKPVGYCPGFANGGRLNGLSGIVNGFYAWTKISTPLLQYQGDKITIKIRSSNEKYFGITQVLFEINEREQTVVDPVQIPEEPIVEIIDDKQVEVIDDMKEDQEQAKDVDPELTQVIQKIEGMMEDISFDMKQDPEFHLAIKYPEDFERKPHFYAKLKDSEFFTTLQLVRELPSYQLFKLNFDQSFLENELEIFMSNENVIEYTAQGIKDRSLTEQKIKLSQSSIPELFKPLKSISVRRFDSLSSEELISLESYAVFFQAITWIVIITCLVLSFFGNNAITSDLFLLLQIIFLHAYIDSAYLPKTFLLVFKGLQRIENMDYFGSAGQKGIEQGLLGNVIQQSPLRFTIYNKDVNFTRAVYPIFIMNLAFLLWYGILTIGRRFVAKRLVIDDEQELSLKQKLTLFFIRISERFLNFWYQIWQIQFLILIWAAFAQLHNLSYPPDSNRSSIPNNIFCFLVLLAMIGLPVATLIYLNKKYFRLDYFEYSYWYKDIFLLKLPSESLPSNHHRINILVKNAKMFLFALVISFLGVYPVPTCTLLIILNLVSLCYIKVSHLEIYTICTVLSFIENCGLILLAILFLAAYGVSSTLGTEEYNILGHFMLVISILLLINALVRVVFYCIKKWKSEAIEKELTEFKPAIGTERVV